LKVLSLNLPPASVKFIDSPSFGQLLPSRTSTEQLEEFWSQWKSSILCDPVLHMIQKCEDVGTEGLEKFAQAFVSFADEQEKNLPAYAAAEMSLARQVFRGLLALLDDWPGIAGSTQPDVDFLLGEGNDKDCQSIGSVFGRAGKQVARALEGGAAVRVWKSLVHDYKHALAGTVQYGDAVHELHNRVGANLAETECADDSIPGETLALLSVFHKNIGLWRTALERPHATLRLEEGIFKLVSRWGVHLASASFSAERMTTLSKVLEILKVVKVDTKAEMLQTVQEKHSDWVESSLVAALQSAASKSMKNQGEVRDLAKALDGMRLKLQDSSVEANPAVRDVFPALAKARWFLWKHCCCLVLGAEFTTTSMEHLAECMGLVHDVERFEVTSQAQDMPASEQVHKRIKQLAAVRTMSSGASFDVTVLKDFQDLQAHFSVDDERPVYSLASPIWDAMRKYFQSSVDTFTNGLKKSLAGHTDEMRKQMDKTAEFWEPTAGGSTHGKSWYANYKPKGELTLVKYFDATLDKMPGLASMDAGMLNLKQVPIHYLRVRRAIP
jgi:hypothetical protein